MLLLFFLTIMSKKSVLTDISDVISIKTSEQDVVIEDLCCVLLVENLHKSQFIINCAQLFEITTDILKNSNRRGGCLYH